MKEPFFLWLVNAFSSPGLLINVTWKLYRVAFRVLSSFLPCSFFFVRQSPGCIPGNVAGYFTILWLAGLLLFVCCFHYLLSFFEQIQNASTSFTSPVIHRYDNNSGMIVRFYSLEQAHFFRHLELYEIRLPPFRISLPQKQLVWSYHNRHPPPLVSDGQWLRQAEYRRTISRQTTLVWLSAEPCRFVDILSPVSVC